MDNFIDHIEIRNFKSIRHLEVGGLKRINLFLGRPNVGKSNLLEALSLFDLSYLEGNWKTKLTDIIRFDSPFQLFFEGNYESGSLLNLTVIGRSERRATRTFSYDKETGSLKIDTTVKDMSSQQVESNVDFYRNTYTFNNKWSGPARVFSRHDSLDNVRIFPYLFKVDVSFKKIITPFLSPPFGENLMYVLELMPELRQTYVQWFSQYGLQLVLDSSTQSVKIQKQKSEYEVFQLPYSSIADTLQRIIFYKTAVASNQNSVLLFEEPEAHAYPPYISEFTHEVVKSSTNQFFIVTHSPLIVEQFLTEAIDDLGIFMVDFKDGQTVMKGLTTDEIKEVYRYGIDLFFNGDSFLD